METTNQRGIIEDIKLRNIGNGGSIALEYYGSKFTYDEFFKMLDEYKKAFLHLNGEKGGPITISAGSTISSVNAMYGVFDAHIIGNFTGPGFLREYTNEYTKGIGCNTVFIMEEFLDEEFIKKLGNAGVKNLVVTSIKDYMNPVYKLIGTMKGILPKQDFLTRFYKAGNSIPKGMNYITLKEFVKLGKSIKDSPNFKHEEGRVAAYFLTGATTSIRPKEVKLKEDGFPLMSKMYDEVGLNFKPGDRNAVFIPIFYATGAIHSIHAGLFSGATSILITKYDKTKCAEDMIKSKSTIAVMTPSHLMALGDSNLKKNALSKVKYVFIGGEAVSPSLMVRLRNIAEYLGIENVVMGYGMTETACLTGLTKIPNNNKSDVNVFPLPGVEYRIVNPETGELTTDMGALEVYSPCQTLGYLDKKKTDKLFSSDGFVRTGDVAQYFGDNEYRVLGRYSDRIENSNEKFYMFELEEKILDNYDISEAEVIKKDTLDGEKMVAFLVLNDPTSIDIKDIVRKIYNINIPGIKHLVGVKIIPNFETNIITAKRDIQVLGKTNSGFYSYDKDKEQFFVSSFDENGRIVKESVDDIKIDFMDTNKKLVKRSIRRV